MSNIVPGRLPPTPWRVEDQEVSIPILERRMPVVFDAEDKLLAIPSWGEGDDPLAVANHLAAAPEAIAFAKAYVEARKLGLVVKSCAGPGARELDEMAAAVLQKAGLA